MKKHDTKIIAVSGKGGVGKTSLAAVMVRHLILAYPNKRILAIDADPAIGLSTALGVDVKMTLDDIRKKIVKRADAGEHHEAIEILNEARFKIFDTMVEQNGFAFLAIGRPEAAGCYCTVNSYLKDVISTIASDFDYVVIDGEAGIEQINRRVMEKVTHLILITDQSRKGVQVIKTIKDVAEELVMYEKIGVIVNRVTNPELNKYIEVSGEEILAYINTDEHHAENDIQGMSIFELPEDSEVFDGVGKALRRIKILR